MKIDRGSRTKLEIPSLYLEAHQYFHHSITETEKNETVATPGQEYHITDRRGEGVVGKELVLHSSVSTDAITRIFNQTPATTKEFAND